MEKYPICKHNWCKIHKTCIYKNAQTHLKTNAYESAIGEERNADIVLCYNKPTFYKYNAPLFDKVVPLQKSVIKKWKEVEIPFQPMPITMENFFIRSHGTFIEIFDIPIGYTEFFKSKKSQYYTNDDKTMLVRISDHWGHKIRFCSWHLKGYPKISSWGWRKQFGNQCRIGIIKFSELKINYFLPKGFTKPKEFESRHPF